MSQRDDDEDNCTCCGDPFSDGVFARSRVDGDVCVWCYQEGCTPEEHDEEDFGDAVIRAIVNTSGDQ